MNEIERSEYTTKKNVWQPLKYKQMKEDGYTPECTSYIKRVKDAIPPSSNTKDINLQIEYILFIEDIREILLSEKTDLEKLAEKTLAYIREKYYQDGKANELKNKLNDVLFYKNLISKIKLQKWYGQEYKDIDFNWSNMIRANTSKKTTENSPKIPKKPYLSFISRTNPDWITDSIDTEIFQDTFKFRAGEFGNWVNQSERQENLNHAFNALKDLADTLNIEDKSVGLNNTLAIAFGSRGKTSALAHYEPARKVINLTKIRGAGSLAHEWFHALDNYLGYLFSNNTGEFLTNLIYDKTTTSSCDQELYKVINELIFNIKYREISIEEKERYEESAKKLEEYLSIDSDLGFIKQESIINDNIKYILQQIQEEKYIEKESKYWNDAVAIDKKENKYWSKMTELVARAFESYITDKIGQSDYLVAHADERTFSDKTKWRANAYPISSERKNINLIFDKLFKVLKEKKIL